MNLYVVFINPLRYESNNKLTQVECHYFTNLDEASDFAEENGGLEVYSRVYWNDDVSEKQLSDIWFTPNYKHYGFNKKNLVEEKGE